jgi:hypothetical protein
MLMIAQAYPRHKPQEREINIAVFIKPATDIGHINITMSVMTTKMLSLLTHRLPSLCVSLPWDSPWVAASPSGCVIEIDHLIVAANLSLHGGITTYVACMW